MNWRRGLWRLWGAASVLWIAFWGWWRDVPCALGFNYFGAKWGCGDDIVALPDGYEIVTPADTFLLMFGVPALTLALAFVVRWIASGFWPRQKSN